MSDPYSRDGVPPVERTVIVNNDRGRGASGWIFALLLIIVLVGGALYVFGGLSGSSGDVDVNLPQVETPDVNIQTPSAPAPAAPAN